MESVHASGADFVSQWQLRFDPFSDDADIPFYAGREIAAALEQIEHHARYGNLMLVVTGPHGAGKTMLRREFVRRSADSAQICALLAHPLHTTAQVLHQVAQAFSLGDDLIGAPGDETQALAERLAHAEPAERLLVIDDADTLDADVVAALVSLVHRLKELPEPPLKLVLFGEPHLAAMLTQSSLLAGNRDDVHLISLNPLRPEETCDYLQHRLAAAGFGQALPLSASQIDELHRSGLGLPGGINREASALLNEVLGEVQAQEEAPETFSPGLRRSLMMFGAVLLAGLLLLQLPKMWGGDAPPAPATARLPVEARITSPVPEIQVPVMSAPADKPVVGEPVTAAPPVRPAGSSPEPALSQREPSQATVAEPVENPVAVENPVPAEKTVPVQQAAPVDKPVSAPKPQPLASKPKFEPRPKPFVPEPKPFVPERQTAGPVRIGEDEAALLQANPAHFMLQLVGVSDGSKLAAYAARSGVREPLHRYQTERGGKPLYILVAGPYASRAAAQAAQARMPGLPERPWLKTVAAVQHDLRVKR